MKVSVVLGWILITLSHMQSELIIYDFKGQSNTDAWVIVNDVVMGGRSDAFLDLNEEGHGVFRGKVSLENNGGFASVRLRLSPIDVQNYSEIRLRVKGDGKRYQMRCKSYWNEPQSYIAYFDTQRDWQEVVIDLRSMRPTFRGSQLDMPDYPGVSLAEIAVLIGNKKEESFSLEIDSIWLK